MTYLIAYDIEDTKMRNQLAHFLSKKGRRVQKSVFLMELNQYSIKTCMGSMKEITKGKGDIIVFPLCNGCQSKALRIGSVKDLYLVY